MATRSWTGDGADALASTTGNWDTGTPVAGDSVTFPGVGGGSPNKNCTWDVTAGLDTLSMNGYTGVVTQTSALNLTSTTGSFTQNTGTWDSNGQTNDIKSLDLSGSGTKILTAGASLWYVRGNLNMSGANTTFNYNTGKMYMAATGTLTMQSGVEFYDLSFSNPGGSGSTITFATDVVVNHTLDWGDAGSGSVTPNGNKIYAKGDVKCTNASYPQGTTVVEFSGSAAQTLSAQGGGGAYGISFIVNKSGNTLTIAASLIFGNNASSNTFTYTAGTVSVSAGTTKFYGTWNLNSGSGVVWDTLRIFDVGLGARTVTLTGNLKTGALTIDANMTLSCGANTLTLTGNFTKNGTFTAATSTVNFNGTSTIAGATTFKNLTLSPGSTTTWTISQSFAITGALTMLGTSGSHITINSSSGGTKATWNLSGTQNASNDYVDVTDNDASAGSKVYAGANGTLSNTTNWGNAAPVVTTSIRPMMMLGVG